MSDDLAGHRKRTGATLIRARIAEKLRTLAGHIARDNVKAGSPTAAFVVLVVPDAPPVVSWAGEVSWDDLQLAQHQRASRPVPDGVPVPAHHPCRVGGAADMSARDHRPHRMCGAVGPRPATGGCCPADAPARPTVSRNSLRAP